MIKLFIKYFFLLFCLEFNIIGSYLDLRSSILLSANRDEFEVMFAQLTRERVSPGDIQLIQVPNVVNLNVVNLSADNTIPVPNNTPRQLSRRLRPSRRPRQN